MLFLFGSCRDSKEGGTGTTVLPDYSKVGTYRSHPIFTDIFAIFPYKSASISAWMECVALEVESKYQQQLLNALLTSVVISNCC